MTLSVTKTQIAGVILLFVGWLNPEQYISQIDLPFVDPTTISVSFDIPAALVVDESGERDAKIADMMALPEVRAYLTAHKVDWRHWDDDTTTGPAHLKELLALPREGIGVPALVMANGKRAKVVKFPEDSTALLAAFKEMWGE